MLMARLYRSFLLGSLALAPAVAVQQAQASDAPYKHVLLISVDGLHAIDAANYVAAHPGGTLAALAHSGLFYSNALTTAPSDSFPGLVAQVTGGTPSVTGVFYDD